MPQSNANRDAGKSDTNGYGYRHDSAGESDSDGYGHRHNASSLAYTQCDDDGDSVDDSKAHADAEVTAYATSSADSVRALVISGLVKQELAR